ncbi:MAG: glucosamine-6-phosphate deaminase [Gemmatimonadetes bacterium]|nr:glucosamine-6-phosphate deaminase [Gemmatimonadota bacterium]
MTSGNRHDAADAPKARETAQAAPRGPSSVSGALLALERIPTVVLADHHEIAVQVARRIADTIRRRNAEGHHAVLGLATGSTPIGVYRELIRMHREEGLSFQRVVSFNLDEYYPMGPDNIHSYHRFMWENLFSHVDIARANVHIPDGTVPRDQLEAWCAAYEQAVRDAGGIDVQLLGIGKTGHIGFNEPGSGEQSRTRMVHLDAVTRRDAAADFFGEEFVPREAVTMGVASIFEAREIIIIATGEHKARVVRRAVEGTVNIEVAATFLQRHPSTTFFVDAAAAGDLTRIATPWLLDEVEWTLPLTLEAVTWLSRTVNKAILKLTQQDYAEHKLSSLVARHGSPGAVNGLVFNQLGAKIRGKSKLPHGKRVVCFSPHPDDDVISMGGILRKLTENGNQITVAYMTSGNIAVFDYDVRRHVDFLLRMHRDHGIGGAEVETLAAKVHAFLAAKQPGDVDIPEVGEIKRLIREAEAISGLETVGLPASSGRFLNLPFYQTGKVKKDPIGPADVQIVKQLLAEQKPEYIFVAGDLSDPHGTHRMCKEAIDAAIAELWPNRTHGPQTDLARRIDDAPPLLQTPEVWLYRGAWQEWPVTEATWLVPMSQEELRYKIQAIFKHQSQKDSMPFPGQDDREFWQRVEQRNKDTAAILDQLGLAEYFAMEAYVVD